MIDIYHNVAAPAVDLGDRDLSGHIGPNFHENTIMTTPQADGHWADPDFPRAGWQYTSHRDLGEFDSAICQVCLVERLRFQHRVTHPEGFDLWASAACASSLCDAAANVIQQRDEQMRDEAESHAQRRVIVSVESYVTGPALWYRRKNMPLMDTGGTGCITLLPFPRARNIAFHITGGVWNLCAECCAEFCSCCADGNRVRRGRLFGVAQYNLDQDKNPTRKFPTCRFAAVILRREDCEAIKTLTTNKPYDYTLKFIHTFGTDRRLEWVEIGAATCKSSEGYLFFRALPHMEEGEWNLRAVLDLPSPPEPAVDLTSLEDLE